MTGSLPLTHPFAQLVGDRSCPAPRDGPFLRRFLWPQADAHPCVPAERVVPQAAVDRPEGWLCRPPPRSGRPGHDAALDPHPGEPVPIPVPGRATSSKRRGSANKGRAAAPRRPAPTLVVGGARPVAPHPALHRAVPPVRADLARHRGLVPADKAGRSRSPPHGSPTRP
mgnify:FL=1